MSWRSSRDPGAFGRDAELAHFGVQPGVVDDGPGGQRKGLQDVAVLLGELVGTHLLGEVEVAEDLPVDEDRHPDEGTHRRMVGGETDRGRVFREVGESQRVFGVEDHPEDALTARQVVDSVDLLGGEPDVHELGEASGTGLDHGERPVAGVDELAGLFDDVAERGIQVEVGFEDEYGVEQLLEALRVGHPPVRHGPSVPRGPPGHEASQLCAIWRDL